ncbi:hypothetical protein QBC44DRAFT_43860 [Cladorrhinum sp. PSN332]|nr:hypothetical protein QBC44DRAFT_43860 [Cladorrhinum sp. PSN332]
MSATAWWTIVILLKLAVAGCIIYFLFKWLAKRRYAREQEALQAAPAQYYQPPVPPNYAPQNSGVWSPQPPSNNQYPGNTAVPNMSMPAPPPYAAMPPRCGGYNANTQQRSQVYSG